jgi:hypothetical protein
MSDKQQLRMNALLFSAFLEPDLTERQILEKVVKAINNGADVDAIDKNFGCTVLETAREQNLSTIVEYLIKQKSAKSARETPEDRLKNKSINFFEKVESVNIPKDGSCLFWAITLAFLTPVRNDSTEFILRLEKLFASNLSSIE